MAKIAILKSYLAAWFRILGSTAIDQDLLYIDGFAGPGRYVNHHEGSPVAALVAAREAIAELGPKWRAGIVHCGFIEENLRFAQHLDQHLQGLLGQPRIEIQLCRDNFVRGVERLKTEMPQSFDGSFPLFAFVDPFGPTGVPFGTIRDLLSSPRSEILINLDADGLARILRAGERANAPTLLNTIFGDDSWRTALQSQRPFRDQSLAIVDLYKERLKSIERVKYVYSFEMLTSTRTVGQVGYFLIFASQHARGLEKMKEAMQSVDQMGDYRFSNARIGQKALLRFDEPGDFSQLLYEQFAGAGRVSYSEVHDFALNETPFRNPKGMLKILEQQGMIRVETLDGVRRKGTFNEKRVHFIEFVKGTP